MNLSVLFRELSVIAHGGFETAAHSENRFMLPIVPLPSLDHDSDICIFRQLAFGTFATPMKLPAVVAADCAPVRWLNACGQSLFPFYCSVDRSTRATDTTRYIST